ncbi:hypothetical protein ACFL3T_00345 [Patescibacteria group bacterium]
MRYDIIIVGASFAGLTLAHHLPKNYRILLLDKKPSLDSPVETTGLITNPTKDEFNSFRSLHIEKYISNSIYGLNVVNFRYTDVFSSSTEHPWIFSLNTAALIKHLTATLPSNVTIKLNAVYGSPNTYFHDGKTHNFKAKFIIGADGANSSVAKSNPNLSQNKKHLIGLEKVFHGEIDQKAIYHFWFGEFSLGYGGWLSPNGPNQFRVGLAKYNDGNGFETLNRFIDRLKKEGFIRPEGEAIEQFGSHIPIGGPIKKPYDKKTLLIGDAAGLCGAFAADGIKGALISAKVAAKLIQKGSFRGYYMEIEKHNYLMSYFKRQKLYRFAWDQMKTNESFDLLFDLVKNEDLVDVFCDSKDKHKSLAGSLIKLKNIPKLAKYGASILKGKINSMGLDSNSVYDVCSGPNN